MERKQGVGEGSRDSMKKGGGKMEEEGEGDDIGRGSSENRV